MDYKYIKEKEDEKYKNMFDLMNKLSNEANEEYEKSKMKRYKIIASRYNLSIETVRKIFQKTETIKQVRYRNYIVEVKIFDFNIHLERLKKRRFDQYSRKTNKRFEKYKEIAALIKKYVKRFKNKLSAATISGILWIKHGIYISPKHIYYLVYEGYLPDISAQIFPCKKYGLYYKKEQKETKRWVATPLYKRPPWIWKRTRYGDLEIDTVEGSKGDNQFLATTICRKSRRLAITLYKDKNALNFKEAIKANINKMLTPVKSITSDNGTENYCLNLLKLDWYATNAYSSWQKGTIEQKHKQLRKFIPKGISMNNLTQDDCDLIALIINCETYLQNTKRYKLGKIVTREELDIFFNLDDEDLKVVLNLYK